MRKRMTEADKLVEKRKVYSVKEAVDLLKKTPSPKFDETVNIAMSFDVDPKQSDQNVRGTVVLPHGTGKSIRVLVFAKGDAERAAKEAGADVVGSEDLIPKIEAGWMDFDAVISTPDLMREIAKLGRVLGPRGLMPSPKAGTVTTDVGKAVKEVRKGKVEFRMDKQADIHLGIGKKSFAAEAIEANLKALMEAVWRAKPAAVKGKYLRSVSVATSMGPGIKLDPSEGKPE
ncbi:MAG: 50S ribosomal protein L1 [Candidatus Omnitrophota bacterium]|nr:50S ribosomal protein L1 [Candidatus Omnitrophota bacterium]